MDNRYEQCDELWRAYAKATTEHVRALKEQRAIAAASVTRFREMEPAIEIAAGTTERARIAIDRHLTEDHGERARAKASRQSWWILEVATRLIDPGPFPDKASADAVHVAAATVYGCEFLLTWNFKHINNAQMKREAARIIGECGYQPPTICTPDELMGSDAEAER